jgi:hypothetical protein
LNCRMCTLTIKIRKIIDIAKTLASIGLPLMDPGIVRYYLIQRGAKLEIL